MGQYNSRPAAIAQWAKNEKIVQKIICVGQINVLKKFFLWHVGLSRTTLFKKVFKNCWLHCSLLFGKQWGREADFSPLCWVRKEEVHSKFLSHKRPIEDVLQKGSVKRLSWWWHTHSLDDSGETQNNSTQKSQNEGRSPPTKTPVLECTSG